MQCINLKILHMSGLNINMSSLEESIVTGLRHWKLTSYIQNYKIYLPLELKEIY